MSYQYNSLISSDKAVVSYEKRLSICLTSNGFSFSVTTLGDELLALGDVRCNISVPMSDLLTDIRGALAEARIDPYGFKESELVVFSRQFVWVPQHLYDDARQRDYLEALCKVENGHGVFTDHNDTIKASLVFSADNNLTSAFKIAIPGLKVHCQHSKMANSTIADSSDLKSVMLMNLRDGETDYAVFCNKKLQISNTFSCSNLDEALYHAVNLTKQFHLEDAMMTVAVCGQIDRERYARMRPFFPNMVLFTGRPLTFANPEMQHIPAYRYALILA